MKKILILTFIITVLILNGCTAKRPQSNSLSEKQENKQGSKQTTSAPEATQKKTYGSKQTTSAPEATQKKTYDFTTNFLPSDWVIEDGFFFSPEMYDARKDGPYSLHITVNNKFSTINDYFKDNDGDCVKDKTELEINNNPAVRFIDPCQYAKPKVTLIQINENLIEAFSYSFSDESKEIEQILETLEIKK